MNKDAVRTYGTKIAIGTLTTLLGGILLWAVGTLYELDKRNTLIDFKEKQSNTMFQELYERVGTLENK